MNKSKRILSRVLSMVLVIMFMAQGVQVNAVGKELLIERNVEVRSSHDKIYTFDAYPRQSGSEIEIRYESYGSSGNSILSGQTYGNGIPYEPTKYDYWVEHDWRYGDWGPYTIKLRLYRQEKSNTNPTLSITNPTVTQIINNSGTITISGTVSDPDTQTLTIQATLGGKTKSVTIQAPVSSRVWSLTWTGSELAEGNYGSIQVTVNDGNGGSNYANHTGTKTVDKTKPTVPLLKADTTTPTNKDVTITVTPGIDVLSGIAKTEYKIGSGGWTTYTSPFKVTSNSTVYARTTDKAGNISNDGSLVVSNIDKVVPVITVNPYTTTPINNSITVTATTNKGTLNKTSHTFDTNGSFTFTATDSAGNKASKIVTITNIDKENPTIVITVQ